MVDWTSGSERSLGILKTTAFSAFAISLCASLATESKKHPVAARSLVIISLDWSIRLADGDIFTDKSFICCTLISSSLSF